MPLLVQRNRNLQVKIAYSAYKYVRTNIANGNTKVEQDFEVYLGTKEINFGIGAQAVWDRYSKQTGVNKGISVKPLSSLV